MAKSNIHKNHFPTIGSSDAVTFQQKVLDARQKSKTKQQGVGQTANKLPNPTGGY